MRFYTNVINRGKNIYVRGWAEGKRWAEVIPYKPSLYVEAKKTLTPGKWIDMFQEKSLAQVNFDDVYEARDFIKQYDGLNDFHIYGSTDWVGQYIYDAFPNEIHSDLNRINVLFMDIEVDSKGGFASINSAENEVISVTLCSKGKYYVLGLVDFKVPAGKNVQYHKCKNERELLAIFLQVWEKADPDVVTGWNTNGYDLPYLINRISRVFGEEECKKLSPWRKMPVLKDAIGKAGRKIVKPYIDGIACLDYFDLYTNGKFVQSQREEYTLDYISRYELGAEKTDYSQYGSLAKLYEQNPQLFIEYNIHDVELVVALDAKLKFLELVYSMAYDAKVNYQDTLGSVFIWENIIRNHQMSKGVIIPLKKDVGEKSQTIVGAYVKNPNPGMYHWVVTFDASSLYPSLIRQLNISPETLQGIKYSVDMANLEGVGWDKAQSIAKEKDWTIASNGAAFDKIKSGCLPELMHAYYQKKNDASKLQIESEKELQLKPDDKELEAKIRNLKSKIFATKVLLNSCFGATSNPYFQFYDDRIAEAITASGQTLIQTAAKRVNEAFCKIMKTNRDYIIASDTDSIIVDCSTIVEAAKWNGSLNPNASIEETTKFLNRLCEAKLNPLLDEIMDELVNKTNAREKAVFMVREAICDTVVWVAAKNYMMRIWNNKGVTYKNPKYKIMGLEAVRSTTPTACRKALKHSIELILDENQQGLISYIDDFKNEFEKAEYTDISKNISVKFGSPTVTQQIRAATVYNNAIKERHLENFYSLISHGSKIRLLHLKRPNPLDSDIIGFPEGRLPKEFGVDAYIDKDAMIEKTFMVPLEKMVKAAGMSIKQEDSLTAFFV